MKWTEAVKLAKDRDWADLELRPTGKILTEEQFNYVLYYARHTSIGVKEAVIFSEIPLSWQLVRRCFILLLFFRYARQREQSRFFIWQIRQDWV